jgi:hypothetical protein
MDFNQLSLFFIGVCAVLIITTWACDEGSVQENFSLIHAIGGKPKEVGKKTNDLATMFGGKKTNDLATMFGGKKIVG